MEKNYHQSETDSYHFFWSPLGFLVAGILLKECDFDPGYLHSKVLRAIFENRRDDAVENHTQNMVLPFDNTTPHMSRVTTDDLICTRVAWAPPLH
jgi:hypothetical protein